MLRRVRKGRLGLPVECGLSASPERTEQERGKREGKREGRGGEDQFCPIIEGRERERERETEREGRVAGRENKERQL